MVKVDARMLSRSTKKPQSVKTTSRDSARETALVRREDLAVGA
jgi:hypothetical protein